MDDQTYNAGVLNLLARGLGAGGVGKAAGELASKAGELAAPGIPDLAPSLKNLPSGYRVSRSPSGWTAQADSLNPMLTEKPPNWAMWGEGNGAGALDKAMNFTKAPEGWEAPMGQRQFSLTPKGAWEAPVKQPFTPVQPAPPPPAPPTSGTSSGMGALFDKIPLWAPPAAAAGGKLAVDTMDPESDLRKAMTIRALQRNVDTWPPNYQE